MAAVTCSAFHAVGVVASARAPAASRGVSAAVPRVSANKAKGAFMAGNYMAAGLSGLSLSAGMGKDARGGARGFEVVAQAISEVSVPATR